MERQLASSTLKPVGASQFKYYLHDSIDAFRIELVGELTDKDVSELTGCWKTARTTLSGRSLIVDVRRLQFIDGLGTAWIESMKAEGAETLSEIVEAEQIRSSKARRLLDRLLRGFYSQRSPAH